MSMFRMVKSMTRPLTEEEQKEIGEYWEANEELTEIQVIEYFEKKFGMPVTRHALMKAMIMFGT